MPCKIGSCTKQRIVLATTKCQASRSPLIARHAMQDGLVHRKHKPRDPLSRHDEAAMPCRIGSCTRKPIVLATTKPRSHPNPRHALQDGLMDQQAQRNGYSQRSSPQKML